MAALACRQRGPVTQPLGYTIPEDQIKKISSHDRGPAVAKARSAGTCPLQRAAAGRTDGCPFVTQGARDRASRPSAVVDTKAIPISNMCVLLRLVVQRVAAGTCAAGAEIGSRRPASRATGCSGPGESQSAAGRTAAMSKNPGPRLGDRESGAGRPGRSSVRRVMARPPRRGAPDPAAFPATCAGRTQIGSARQGSGGAQCGEGGVGVE
jgi:hypothetical protein